MIGLNDLLIFYLVFHWIMCIFYKLNVHLKLYDLITTKFIDELTSCEFCMETHVANLMAICLFVYSGDYWHLLFGILSASISNIIKRLGNA